MGYAVVQDRQLRNHLVAFDPGGATPPRDLLVRDAYLPDIALGPDGLVWLADMSLPTPGLDRFDPLLSRMRRSLSGIRQRDAVRAIPTPGASVILDPVGQCGEVGFTEVGQACALNGKQKKVTCK